MKKSIIILVLLVMTVILFACASKPMVPSETDEPKVSDNESVDIADTEEPKVRDTEEADTAETEPSVDVIESEGLPIPKDGTEFYFSSGAGAWYSSLILNKDGSFTGSYHDSEMGAVGEGYPHGSVYTSEFSGRFTNIEKINSYSYRMTLEYVETEKPAGEEWIEEERRYVASEPFGIAGGEEFIFYLPETPAKEAEGAFLTWWPLRYWQIDEYGNFTGEPDTTLDCYGIHNVKGGYGFFEYK